MLKSLFILLDRTPQIYSGGIALAGVILVGWMVRESVSAPVPVKARWQQTGAVGVLLALALFAGRWPFLLSAVEYNPDESQLLAGAITLTHDPVFWRSVDGTTSGPLNFYVLLPIHWLGAPIDYFTARVVGLLLVWSALMATYAAFRAAYGRRLAAWTIAPTTVFFALVHEWDFIHFSSEHVAMALFAFSAAALSRAASGARRVRGPLWVGGVLAGLLPWSKLQAGPLGLVLVVCGAWFAARPRGTAGGWAWREAAVFAAFAALPTVLFVAGAAAMGEGDTLLQNYFLQNLLYVDGGNSVVATLQGLRERAAETHLLPLLLLAQVAAISAALLVAGGWRSRDPRWWIGGASASVAVWSVLVPGRPFLHYTLLLVFPLLWWSGAALARLSSSTGRRKPWTQSVLVASVVLGTLAPAWVRILQSPPDVVGRLAFDWRHPRSSLGNVLRAAAAPSDQLATWGWYASLHVESGLPQATRLGYSYWSIMPSPVRDYHRDLYLADLMRNQPTFFVDAVGPESFYFLERATQAHETFPALADYIRANYSLVVDFGYARLFVRNDQVMRPALVGAALRQAVAAGRDEDRPPQLPIEDPALPALPRKLIGGKNVVMMLPPAELSWPLGGIEKEFLFEYGYDPVAYAQIGQGNGTEIQVTIRTSSGSEEVLFRRLLDPAHVPADRGPQSARIVLPPVPLGAVLTVETSPGAYNDNSWDWAYVTSPRFVRYPHYVLPSRVAQANLGK